MASKAFETAQGKQAVGFGGRQAVVIGGSIAGLLAARVLAEHFEQVTLVERDRLADSTDPRKGVPQGRHAHGLLARGQTIIEDLFPDLFEDLVASGSLRTDMSADVRWFQFGYWKAQFPSGVTAYTQSRPMLEAKIRERVRALPNVCVRDGCDVVDLWMDAAGASVIGVHVQERGEGQSVQALSAQLVVDAGGRGSRTPQWLVAHGFPQVEESVVTINIGYASRSYRLAPGAKPAWKALMIYPHAPFETRLGIMLPMEGNRWMVTLAGWHRDYPPTDDAGFLDFMRSLPVPDLYEVLKDAEPLGSAVSHKQPSNLRRHYERLDRFPEGLAVLGDALCSFNPTYGQGMTTSALDVQVLDSALRAQARRQGAGNIAGLAGHFRHEVAKAVELPWMMATGEDFRFAETTGRRPPGQALLHRYIARLHAVTSQDTEVLSAFLQVMNMMQPITALFTPRVLFRVLTARLAPGAPPVTAPRPADPASRPATLPTPATRH